MTPTRRIKSGRAAAFFLTGLRVPMRPETFSRYGPAEKWRLSRAVFFPKENTKNN